MKKAIVVSSFGTTHLDALESCAWALEKQVRKEFPEYTVVSAFTSGKVRGKLKQSGIDVPSPEEALGALADDGFESVFLLPTHLLPGLEYEKLKTATSRFKSLQISLARPLLGNESDYETVLDTVKGTLSHNHDHGLLLMGHGSEHPSNVLYTRMNAYIRTRSKGNIFVATVEAEPGLTEAIEWMRAAKVKRILVTPLLFVAGDHAKNDMAGEEDSWLVELKEAGFLAGALIKGLGEYPEIRALYCEHLREILV